MTVSSEGMCVEYERFLHSFFRALENDLRVRIVIELLHNGPLSFRALGRRLRVNYRRLNEALKYLVVTDIVRVYIVKVSPVKSYKFYSINETYTPILKTIMIQRGT